MSILLPFSFQIFSAREFPPISEQIRTVAEIGFTNIEAYRALYDAPQEMRTLLDENGLTVKTGHFALAALEDDFAGNAEIARTLGMERIIVPSMPFDERDKDVDGWKDIGRRLAVLAAKAADAGFLFGWHNHAFEFVQLADGSFPIEHILGTGIDWQVDIAWIVKSGQDPVKWLERYSGRVFAIHFKDLAVDGENTDEMGWADPGKGILPWDIYWKAAEKAGATIAIAEHDHPSDYVRFARNAMTRLRELTAGDKA